MYLIKHEDKIEKELLKKLEEKHNSYKNDKNFKKEIKYENEVIKINPQDNNNINDCAEYNFHFNEIINPDLLKNSPKILNKKVNLFNEKLGHFQYLYNNNLINLPREFNAISKISKYLLNAEDSLQNILLHDYNKNMNDDKNLNDFNNNKTNDNLKLLKNPNKIDLNYQNFLNYRLFKYLDNFSDIYLNLSDLNIRQKFMNIYLFHILNHMMKRKEEIEINNRIEKLIEKYSNENFYNENAILKDDLFINLDEEFLQKYLKESEIKNFPTITNSTDKNIEAIFANYFEEYKIKEKLKNKMNNFNFTNEDNNIILDQGFTSPRILILVPNKKHARLLVEEMISILRKGNWKGVSNKKKFKEEFSEAESLGDCFRLGINFDFFSNKLRLYQPFDNSEIIIASPLGLKLTSVNDEDPSVKNKKVYDFLSSIEILLIDFAEGFLHQNMEHLEEILSFLNKTPKNNQNIVNINRIKDCVKENQLEYLRQTIVVSHFKSLEIEMLVRKYCKNLKGGMYVMNEKYENILEDIGKNLLNYVNISSDDSNDEIDVKEDSKFFSKIATENNLIKYEFKMLKTFDDMDIFDYKFNYFTKNLWQNIYDTFDRHTIIFTSALDYKRLVSFFKKNSVAVTFISEDTDKKDWQRNRLFFEEGRYKFLLYSERAHFYKKINLKFAKNIFFYSLPEDPAIFKEMMELIQPSHYKKSLRKYKIEDKNLLADNYSAVIALVSKMEKYNLEKIIGTDLCNYIYKNKLDNYVC